jgi:hypothetical protein
MRETMAIKHTVTSCVCCKAAAVMTCGDTNNHTQSFDVIDEL